MAEVTLDALDAFVVFSETLNFTHAAEQLFISQPALHVKIKKLATELGVPLYVKQGRSLRLTTHGKRVSRFAREARGSLDQFVADLRGEDKKSRIVLAAGKGCYLYLLDRAILKFQEKSKAQLKLVTSDRQRTLESLRIGEADVGVTVLRSKPADLIAKRIIDVPAKLVTPAGSELSAKRSINIKQLQGLALIVPSRERPHREMIEAQLDSQQVDWRVAIEADGWDLAIKFVELGIGHAIVNGCCQLPRGVLGVPIRDFPAASYFLCYRRTPKNKTFAGKVGNAPKSQMSAQQMLCQLILEHTR